MSDEIKLKGSAARAEIEAWVQTMRHLAEAGIRTVCYNFMPLLDWTCTDLDHHVEGRGRALRFDMVDFVAYDADNDYPEGILRAATARYRNMTAAEREALERNIIAGLPGSATGFTRDRMRKGINAFSRLSHDDLRANLAAFFGAVLPEVEVLGIKLAIHPDDPPMPLFGLPRCVSTADDLRFPLASHPGTASGLTFCTGSLGAHPDNDLPGMVREFGNRIHFAHLRDVQH